MKKGLILRALFSASFVFVVALCAMVTVSGKDAAAAEATVAAADGSSFSISVGSLFLRREGTHNYILVSSIGPGGTKTVLDSQSLNLDDYEPGLDVSAAYKSKGGLEANFRYFGLNSWSEDSRIVLNRLVDSKPMNPGTEGLASAATIYSSYSSQLDSAEINMGWWPVEYIGVFAGPRHLTIDESNKITILNDSVAFSSSADNELWGGQVGVKANLFKTRRGCTASLWGKAGYYDNAISTKFGIHTNFEGSSIQARGKSHTGTFAGEAGFDYKIVVVPHVALSTGYEILWIEKTALATAGNYDHIVDTDSVLYHGAKVALTIDW